MNRVLEVLIVRVCSTKNPARAGFCFSPRKEEELCFLLVFIFEFLHATCSIHKHFLTSEKRMRCRANFHLDHRIFLTIFPLQRFFGIGSRTAQKFGIA